jgi:hypothetical protein
MEPVAKQRRRRDKIQTIYSRCLLTRKIILPMKTIGKNLQENIEENINYRWYRFLGLSFS